MFSPVTASQAGAAAAAVPGKVGDAEVDAEQGEAALLEGLEPYRRSGARILLHKDRSDDCCLQKPQNSISNST